MKVYIPEGRTSYYARFQFRGRVVFQTLKTDQKRVATKRAQALLDTAHERFFEGADVGKKTTLGQILDAYRAAPLGITERTKSANISYFLRIAAPGVSPEAAAGYKAVDCLTRKAVMAYQTSELQKGRAGASINSDVRQGRSILSRQFRERLKGADVALPFIVKEFLEVTPLTDKKSKRGYVPIARSVLADMDAALASLRIENVDMWLVISLARRLGLRNSEILAARGSWLIEMPEGMVLELRNSDEFQIKNGVEGAISLDIELAEALRGKSDKEFLVGEGLGKSARHDLVYRKVSKWMRQWLPGRTKALYELRKEAGSAMAAALGLDAAQKLLRHRSVQTTRTFYIGTTVPSPSITTLA